MTHGDGFGGKSEGDGRRWKRLEFQSIWPFTVMMIRDDGGEIRSLSNSYHSVSLF